eukprot:1815878-Pyramimonas_sp.AAC.1
MMWMLRALPLTVALLHVLEAVELLRQREDGLGEHFEVGDVNAKLALLRALHAAARADDVADVHLNSNQEQPLTSTA